MREKKLKSMKQKTYPNCPTTPPKRFQKLPAESSKNFKFVFFSYFFLGGEWSSTSSIVHWMKALASENSDLQLFQNRSGFWKAPGDVQEKSCPNIVSKRLRGAELWWKDQKRCEHWYHDYKLWTYQAKHRFYVLRFLVTAWKVSAVNGSKVAART